MKLSRTWKKTNQIPQLHTLQYIKTYPPKSPIQSMLIIVVEVGVITPKDKKSPTLANQKPRVSVSFASIELPALNHGTKSSRIRNKETKIINLI